MPIPGSSDMHVSGVEFVERCPVNHNGVVQSWPDMNTEVWRDNRGHFHRLDGPAVSRTVINRYGINRVYAWWLHGKRRTIEDGVSVCRVNYATTTPVVHFQFRQSCAINQFWSGFCLIARSDKDYHIYRVVESVKLYVEHDRTQLSPVLNDAIDRCLSEMNNTDFLSGKCEPRL